MELRRSVEGIRLLFLFYFFKKKSFVRSERQPTTAHNGSGRGLCSSFVGDLPLKLKVSLGANKVSHGALYPGATRRARNERGADAVLRICLEEALPMA